MPEPIHIPVLMDEVLANLAPTDGGIYCDGTMGGAGHSLAILAACGPTGRVISIDRDAAALERARERIKTEHADADRITLVHATFGEVKRVLAETLTDLGRSQVDGFVLDLGLSSIQLDTAERGFSFAKAGPIDMRMNQNAGPTALDLIRDSTVEDLAAMIKEYGEERYSKRVAAALKREARAGNLNTTHDLAQVTDAAIPGRAKRHLKIHPATRTFQALRIAVNRELDQLAEFLEVFPDLLAPNGRCVIISFHSLEDRMVKRRFRDLAWSSSLPPDLARQAGERVDPICRVVTRRPVTASPEEISANSRARSAKLRACERLAA